MTVNQYEVTCYACPTQLVGTFDDGRRFYFRYRWGVAALTTYVTERDEEDSDYAEERVGDDLDGVLSTGEALELIERLAAAS